MQQRTVAFRVEGGQQQGFGHLVRCRALAAQLDDVAVPVYFTNREGATFLRDNGCQNVHEYGLTAFRDHLFRHRPSTVVTDVKNMEDRDAYLVAVKESRIPHVGIHDMAIGTFQADVTIDGSPLAPALYAPSDRPGLCLGTQHVILEKVFSLWRRLQRPPCSQVRRVFVGLGGGAHPEPLGEVMSFLRDDGLMSEATVSVGISDEGVPSGLTELERQHVYSDLTRLEYLKALHGADLAILASGISMFEALCLGVPCIIVSHDVDQLRNAEAVESRQACISAGLSAELTSAHLRSCLEKLQAPNDRVELARSGRRLVDGNGLFRCARTVREVLVEATLPAVQTA